jgi:hypothetical protein
MRNHAMQGAGIACALPSGSGAEKIAIHHSVNAAWLALTNPCPFVQARTTG